MLHRSLIRRIRGAECQDDHLFVFRLPAQLRRPVDDHLADQVTICHGRSPTDRPRRPYDGSDALTFCSTGSALTERTEWRLARRRRPAGARAAHDSYNQNIRSRRRPVTRENSSKARRISWFPRKPRSGAMTRNPVVDVAAWTRPTHHMNSTARTSDHLYHIQFFCLIVRFI